MQNRFVLAAVEKCFSFWGWLVESSKRDENPFSIALFWFLVILAAPIWVPYVLGRSIYYRIYPIDFGDGLKNFED